MGRWRKYITDGCEFKIAEAIGLPADAFVKYFDGIGKSESGTKRQDKLKIIKYPDMGELGQDGKEAQGGVDQNYF